MRDDLMPRAWMIDPVGGHRGMHYYDFALCAELGKAGVDVTLLTCEETKPYAAPAGLRVRYPFQRIFGSDPAPVRALRYAHALHRIDRDIAHQSVDIAHLHYFLLGPVDWLFLRRLRRRGIRVVVTAHDVVPFNAKWYTLALYQQLYGLADALIVHAEQNRKELLDRFDLGPGKVSVIPHGHYLPYVGDEMLERQEARARLGVEPERPVLLFFGQIKKVKGLDVLIRALPAVAERFPRVLLLIAGQVWKDDWERYEALIRGLGLEDHVRSRIEHIPDDDVAAYFRAADLVVLPYRRIYQSGVLLMAWSYGCPVVASDVGGLSETVSSGETGLLVPPDDPSALADALGWMLSHRREAAVMGRTACSLVGEEFSWDRIAGRTAGLYGEVLAG